MPDTEADILIVDDDPGMRETLADFLELEQFTTRAAANVTEANSEIAQSEPDLILLDLNMPGGGGLPFAAELRATSLVPIIIISGKGEMVDRVVGLEVGADDYLAKPFELRELLARVRALLRRARPSAAAPIPSTNLTDERRAQFGDVFVLDAKRRTVRTNDGQPLDLTGAEYNLLVGLVERPNRVVSRDTIFDLLHSGEVTAFDRSVDTLVSRLRRKLGQHADASRLIQTVRGEGYVLASDVEWSDGAVR